MQNEDPFAVLTQEQLDRVATLALDLLHDDKYGDLEPVRKLYRRTERLLEEGLAEYQLKSEHTSKVIEKLAELQGKPTDQDVCALVKRVFRRVDLDIDSFMSLSEKEFERKLLTAVASRDKGSSFLDVHEETSVQGVDSEVGTLPVSTMSAKDTGVSTAAGSTAASASTAGR
jgi:hypothetical protein